MEVPVVKIKNIVKGSIIGIGGHHINDVIDNFHKVLAEKVIFPWNHFYEIFREIDFTEILFYSKIFQENSFTWTMMKVELAVIVNPNGMFIIGIKPKNVLSKNLPVLVHPDNILLIILLHEVQNVIVSRIMCSIQL